MWERHSNKRATWRWRSLSTPLRQWWIGTGEDTKEKSFDNKDLQMSESPLRIVYKAKRVSSVLSLSLWEPPGARAGWAGWGPGGDGAGSAALALSSRNLSNSTGTMKWGLISFGWINRNIYTHCCCWNRHTFTGHSFLCTITFLMERMFFLKRKVIFQYLSQ